jgi:hypothetical protein
MARPKEYVPTTLEDAVEQLRREPLRSLRIAVNDVELEVRLVGDEPVADRSKDVLAGIGPWEGESTDELLRIIHEGRRKDDPRFRSEP